MLFNSFASHLEELLLHLPNSDQPCADLSLLSPTPKNDCSFSLYTNAMLKIYCVILAIFELYLQQQGWEQHFQAGWHTSEHFLCALLA